MSSLNNIGIATSEVHAKLDEIRRNHAEFQNEIVGMMNNLSGKMHLAAMALQNDIDRVMNGETTEQPPILNAP